MNVSNREGLKMKVRFKIIALLFCMAMLGFIVIGNRESMSGGLYPIR
jgi:hypothetical protein